LIPDFRSRSFCPGPLDFGAMRQADGHPTDGDFLFFERQNGSAISSIS
jgi:hypothetical protein